MSNALSVLCRQVDSDLSVLTVVTEVQIHMWKWTGPAIGT